MRDPVEKFPSNQVDTMNETIQLPVADMVRKLFEMIRKKSSFKIS